MRKEEDAGPANPSYMLGGCQQGTGSMHLQLCRALRTAPHLRCACWPYQVRLQTDSRHTLSMACMGMQSRTCKAGM